MKRNEPKIGLSGTRSAERESWSGNGAGSGVYRNRLERGATFSRLMLHSDRSHALAAAESRAATMLHVRPPSSE